MARTRPTPAPAEPEATVTEDTSAEDTTPTEAVTEASTEAPAEDTTEQATEAQAEETFDLTPFTTAADEAVRLTLEQDASGSVPDGLKPPVTAAYRALHGAKAKRAAREYVENKMREQMAAGQLPPARAYMDLQDVLTAGPVTGADKPPADPTQAFVEQVSALRLAQYILERRVPEGVAEGWGTKVEELATSDKVGTELDSYFTWLDNTAEDKGDAPQVSAPVANAIKLAQGKAARRSASTGTRTPHEGPKRDIVKHVLDYFGTQPVGEWRSVAQIRAHESEQYPKSDPASPGAISIRLFPKDNKPAPASLTEGEIKVEPRLENGVKGAVRTA